MNDKQLKSILLAVCLGATTALAACSEPQDYAETEQMDVEVENDEAQAAEDSAAAVVAEEPAAEVPAAPVDQLPSESRTSEQSVQPDSETLFY